MNAFIESQFSHCPLVWMFCFSRKLNTRMNHLHERGLRIVYEDYTSTFEELLNKDESVSIHHRNIQLVAIQMFKVKNGLCPKIMKDLFQLPVILVPTSFSIYVEWLFHFLFRFTYLFILFSFIHLWIFNLLFFPSNYCTAFIQRHE